MGGLWWICQWLCLHPHLPPTAAQGRRWPLDERRLRARGEVWPSHHPPRLSPMATLWSPGLLAQCFIRVSRCHLFDDFLPHICFPEFNKHLLSPYSVPSTVLGTLYVCSLSLFWGNPLNPIDEETDTYPKLLSFLWLSSPPACEFLDPGAVLFFIFISPSCNNKESIIIEWMVTYSTKTIWFTQVIIQW